MIKLVKLVRANQQIISSQRKVFCVGQVSTDCDQVKKSKDVVEDVIADNLGVLKLTDFGFAKETHTRDTLQTPCYTPYYVGKFSH